MLAAIAALTGALVLAGGWLLGSETLRRISHDYASMVPSTAVCFLLAGLLLLLKLAGILSGRALAVAGRATAIIVAGVAFADLAVIASGAATGIDDLLWPGLVESGVNVMSPGTAVSFLLVAVLLDRRPASASDPRALPFVTIASLGLVISLVVLITYAFDAQALYAVTMFAGMALHTALCFAALFTAFLLTRPGIGWVGILLGPESGSVGARRMLPLVVLLPLGLCLAALELTWVGVLDANFRLSLLAILMVGLMGAGVLRNAAAQNRASSELRELAENLAVAVADRDLLLREVYHRVKNNLQQVNALIHLESTKCADPGARAGFEAVARRVRALSTVHRLLVATGEPSRLLIGQFLSELCENLARGVPEGLSVTIEADQAHLQIDVATSVGLLVNELVTNALKHAFPGRETGRVTVRYRVTREGGGELTVADDGIGVPGGADAFEGGTGATIVRGLASQLDARLEISSGPGTTVTLVIPRETVERGSHD